MFRRSYKRNIPLMTGVEILRISRYYGRFWILFLSQNGMSLLQIGLLESIFHATGIVLKFRQACWQIDFLIRPICT